ncbi:SulP family inorganic anion transporter [Defluviimonas aestuarii]|uniref:SulP family inorganic anion transporter n=1 Tax=Albidovulum aestuarii TaxID=1130726 RepID=UPI00249AC789|nr:SulP family inorganic anion transporter [Defluviimonas aestuarii]MDI3334954.1 SulP family inorganic anion transporter [Defluviimonas aestuarii]
MHPELIVTLRGYNRSLFLADLTAGITVAMVALPLSIAIAIASGATPAQGLVTAIIGGFLISAFGGSRVQIGGPTGAFIVVVYAVIAEHGYDGLLIATLMAGALLLIAAALRLGNLIAFIPEAVVNGFTIGIAAIIATSQMKDLLGLQTGSVPADFLEKLPVLWQARDSLSLLALGLGLLTMVLIVVFRRAAPKAPGLIVAVALTSAAVVIFDLPIDTINDHFGALPQSLPLPALPEITLDRLTTLLPSAFVIAFLAGVESLLSAMVADRMTDTRHRPNAEVLAQGLANIGSAFMGGLPATGAIARTATNIRAGGRTPVAGIIHALTILIFVLAAAPLAGYLAMPALAALLILTAWNMSEPQKWGHYARARKSDRILLILTLVLTLVADLTVAIGVGVAVGLALRLRRRNVPPAEWDTPER